MLTGFFTFLFQHFRIGKQAERHLINVCDVEIPTLHLLRLGRIILRQILKGKHEILGQLEVYIWMPLLPAKVDSNGSIFTPVFCDTILDTSVAHKPNL